MARTIQHLRSYPSYSDKSELYTYYNGKNFSRIPSTEILITLKVAVDTVGIDVLGFTRNTVGIHSVRSSLAMVVYLAKDQI